MVNLVVAILLATGPATQASRPDPLLGPPTGPPQRLEVTATAARKPGAAGRWTVRVGMTPIPGVHVYAPGNPGYIGVSLALTLPPSLTAGTPRFPAAEPYVFGPLKEVVSVYEKPFVVEQDVSATAKAALSGPLEVTATVRYQACTDRVCYPPQEITAAVTLPAGAGAKGRRQPAPPR